MSETRPRYTVELTTEGWQIKDDETGHLLASTFGSKRSAQVEANMLRIEALPGSR